MTPPSRTSIVRLTTESLVEDQRWGFMAAGYVEMGGEVLRFVDAGDDWIDVEIAVPDMADEFFDEE